MDDKGGNYNNDSNSYVRRHFEHPDREDYNKGELAASLSITELSEME